jgi:hypothetical protein
MKRNAKRLMCISLFVVLTVSFCLGLLAEKVPPEVFQAAREGVSNSPLGLSTKAALDNPTVHHGFQVYTVSPLKLLNSTGLSSILTPTGLWRFVVVKEGQPVSLISVAEIEGQWKAVSIGGTQLAVEVARVMERWPAEQGFSHRFTRIYQARADFIEISSNGRCIGFVPLTASRLAFGMSGEFDPAALLHSPEIMPRLQRAAVETINKIKEK